MQCSKQTLVRLGALLWFGVGLGLMLKGIHFLLDPPTQGPLLKALMPMIGGPTDVALVLLAVGLMIGALKGRLILGKAARRTHARIAALEEPCSLRQLMTRRDLILIALMIALGLTLRFLGVPHDIRGTVLVAVGSALLQGAALSYRGFKPELPPIS